MLRILADAEAAVLESERRGVADAEERQTSLQHFSQLRQQKDSAEHALPHTLVHLSLADIKALGDVLAH